MILPAETAARERVSENEPEQSHLYDLLIALGFTARERVSINSRVPSGQFRSTLLEVRDVAAWTPPQDRDVWFGVNPVGRQVRYGRGAESDITRVRALFADLDVKPGKQLDEMSQCYEAARLLRHKLEVWPVALIKSGHGLQPIWRVGSPRGDSNVIDRDWSRDEWKLTYARWGALVQQAARDAMWSPNGSQNTRGIDNVFELARVLRCPGSVNWKDPDAPVPVEARLIGCAGQVRPSELVAILDLDSVGPIAPMRAVGARVATNLAEADAWITEQPGAELDLAQLQERPRSRVLWEYLDPAALVDVLDDSQRESHGVMRNKVLHAVYSAQEGRAGLVLALNNVQEAYLALMEARDRGERVGDVRDAATAADDVRRAVVGAVARARARGNPVVPNVDAWGPRAVSAEPVRGGRRYWPRYRPQYQPQAKGRRRGR